MLAVLPLLLLTLALAAAAGGVRAEVWRCTVDGRTVYTDRPCADGRPPAQLPPITPIDPQPTETPLTRQFDAEARREAARKRAANAEWADAYAAKKAHETAVRRAILNQTVVRGMTPAEVRQSLGEPSWIDGDPLGRMDWVYENGRDRRHLRFQAGALTSERRRTGRRTIR